MRQVTQDTIKHHQSLKRKDKMRQNTSFDKRDHRAIKYSGTRQRRIIKEILSIISYSFRRNFFFPKAVRSTFFAGSAVLDCA